MNKKPTANDLYRGLGSIDLVAAARSVIQVDCSDEDENKRVLKHIKSSLAPKGNEIFFSINFFGRVDWQMNDENDMLLGMNVVFVQMIGTAVSLIYGVLLGTFIALLYRTNDILIYTNRHILNRSAWKTYRRLAVFLALFVGLKLLSKMLTLEMNNYFTMVMYAIPYALICAGLYFAASYLIDKKSTQYLLSIVKTKFLHKT